MAAPHEKGAMDLNTAWMDWYVTIAIWTYNSEFIPWTYDSEFISWSSRVSALNEVFASVGTWSVVMKQLWPCYPFIWNLHWNCLCTKTENSRQAVFGPSCMGGGIRTREPPFELTIVNSSHACRLLAFWINANCMMGCRRYAQYVILLSGTHADHERNSFTQPINIEWNL